MNEQKKLARVQYCGCIVCACENDEQCLGCGAKHCGTHPVGEIPNPIYEDTSLSITHLAKGATMNATNWTKDEVADHTHLLDASERVEAILRATGGWE